jgi:hypothetical protein
MWTTDAWKYVLQRHEDGYLPIDMSGDVPMAVWPEDSCSNSRNDAYKAHEKAEPGNGAARLDELTNHRRFE